MAKSASTKYLGNERGQIFLPALFILPSFFLFTFLLIETGNLSRAKIRQQFALDAAATVEMELYTDTLNRLAYMNGVFPDRIFREVYGIANTHYGGSGLYPSAVKQWRETDEVWPIRYAGFRAYANNPNPPLNFGIMHTHMPGGGNVTLDNANKMAVGYIQVYRWLGNVATSQKLVFEHTVKDHGQLRKSMFYNLRQEEQGQVGACASSAENCGSDSAHDFFDISIRMHYLSGFKHCPVIISIKGESYVGELTGAFNFKGKGLWQLATVPPEQLAALKRGYVIKHHWCAPKNFFGIDFCDPTKTDVYKKDTGNIEEYEARMGNTYKIDYPTSKTGGPFVRARVTSSGGQVWPDTTPTYMTRLHP